MTNVSAGLRCFVADSISSRDAERWREFAASVPWSHYFQDPTWAEIERCGGGVAARRPYYFWAERDGAVCLTALGIRRGLPVPGRAFWEFKRGPTVLDVRDLDEWLAWLIAHRTGDVARLRLQPPQPLDEGGDDVETILERYGFVRRRALGGWTTLTIDTRPDDEQVLALFRPATQRSIKKSLRLGIEVHCEDTPCGWSALVQLENELALRAPVSAVSKDEMSRISVRWLADGRGGTVLVARYGSEPLACGLVIARGDKAYLPLIPSSRQRRDLPASHLLVFEAARWARSHGCSTLDLVGYSMMARPGDALWGINQFKRGFASLDRLTRSVAIHERVFSPVVVAAASTARQAQAWKRRIRGGREA